MKDKLMVVVGDDDTLFNSTLKLWLEAEGHKVVTFSSPDDFVSGVQTIKPDIVFLDVVFGGQDGRKICSELNKSPNTCRIAVILVSALRKEAMDMADGLEHGADDYLAKPLDRRLFIAKLNSVMQRLRDTSKPACLNGDGLSIDASSRKVVSGDREITLTRMEFDLLAYILRRPGQVLTARQLLEAVWGYGTEAYNDPATVQVHISRLRKKLGENFSKRLATLVNVGYRYDA
jgi:DNA-binding response OmpR family regulator